MSSTEIWRKFWSKRFTEWDCCSSEFYRKRNHISSRRVQILRFILHHCTCIVSCTFEILNHLSTIFLAGDGDCLALEAVGWTQHRLMTIWSDFKTQQAILNTFKLKKDFFIEMSLVSKKYQIHTVRFNSVPLKSKSSIQVANCLNPKSTKYQKCSIEGWLSKHLELILNSALILQRKH